MDIFAPVAAVQSASKENSVDAIGSQVTGLDGQIVRVIAYENSSITLRRGSIGVVALRNSILSVFAGGVGSVTLLGTSAVNLYGGAVAPILALALTSQLNIFGSDFRLNGEPILELVRGQPFLVTTRSATLTSRPADGSYYSMFLTAGPHSGAVRVAMTPEPSTVALALGALGWAPRRRLTRRI